MNVRVCMQLQVPALDVSLDVDVSRCIHVDITV